VSDAILGESVTHCKVYILFAVSCAETAELIDVSFGLWTRVSRKKHKLVIFARWRQRAHMGGHVRRHLANTTEPSICGGDAVLCQITLTTCRSSSGSSYKNKFTDSVAYGLYICCLTVEVLCLHCFDAVGWAEGRASGL